MDRRSTLSWAATLGAVVLSRSVFAQSAPVNARNNAAMKVEAVQMPAWINTVEGRKPIEPGTQVSTAQEIQTAQGAALALRLPEGSVHCGGLATVDPRSLRVDVRAAWIWARRVDVCGS